MNVIEQKKTTYHHRITIISNYHNQTNNKKRYIWTIHWHNKKNQIFFLCIFYHVNNFIFFTDRNHLLSLFVVLMTIKSLTAKLWKNLALFYTPLIIILKIRLKWTSTMLNLLILHCFQCIIMTIITIMMMII